MLFKISLNNDFRIIELLDIPLEEVIFSNQFSQRKTKAYPGIQIDLLIQTKFNCLYVCEIKLSKSALINSVIEHVQQKIDKLTIPRNFSYRPVLIHVNGVRKDVQGSGFFAHIIDFGQFLNEN